MKGTKRCDCGGLPRFVDHERNGRVVCPKCGKTGVPRSKWGRANARRNIVAPTCSAFVADAINKRLAELREQCGVKRILVAQANGMKWGQGEYWDNLQRQAQIDRPKDVEAADKALAEFIAEHRPMMGPDWIGNEHGRLCWAPYLGGMPIAQHYCQREEGHEGNHWDHVGAWPQGVTNAHEWHRFMKVEP